MGKNGPSLRIELTADVMRVRLTARLGCENELRRIAINFTSSVQRSPNSVEVELDDLLTNLGNLNKWPEREDGDVIWDENLKDLVIDSLADAQSLSDELREGFDAKSINKDDILRQLGRGWIGSLTDFQLRDIAKLKSLRHGANFSVPGAGKTRVGLAIFQAMREQQGFERLLIVGPKSSYDAWLHENIQCLRNPLHMDIAENGITEGTEAIIVNYERLSNLVNTLGRWLSERPSMIILDEAHRMKLGANGTYGSACLALGPRAKRRLILTGTPAPNGARDLENLLGFVWPGTGRQSVIRAVNGGDLSAASRILKPLFTRTTKTELDLPPVETSLRTVSLPTLHSEIYDALLGYFSARAIGQESDFQSLGRVMVYMLMAATSPALLAVGTTQYEPLVYQVPPLPIPKKSSLYQLMQDLPAYEMSPKYREVLTIVAKNAALGKKTLVWSTFIRSLNTLHRMLSSYKPAIVHGGSQNRLDEIQRFRNDPECMVLLSNPATLGEGISLHHECHDAVYVDRDFAAGRFLQSLDRVHRLGLSADTTTHITVLASEGTIDEVVASRLQSKLTFMGGILDDPSVQQLADLDEDPTATSGLDQLDLQSLIGHLRAPSI